MLCVACVACVACYMCDMCGMGQVTLTSIDGVCGGIGVDHQVVVLLTFLPTQPPGLSHPH
jgi:hypothetical protein